MELRLRLCRNADEASDALEDPVVLASLLLSRGNTYVYSGKLMDIVGRIIDVTRSSNGAVGYLKLSGSSWEARAIIYIDRVVAILIKYSERTLKGSEAFELLVGKKMNEDVTAILSLVSLNKINAVLARAVEECKEVVEPLPQAFIGRKILGLDVESILSSEGGFNYVLLAKSSIGRRYAIKVIKEREARSPDKVLDDIRGAINALDIVACTIDEVRRNLEALGYSPSLAEELYVYRKYIAIPLAITLIGIETGFSSYPEYPPAVVEELADMGTLEKYVEEKKGLSLAELVYVSTRVCGALALAHSLNILHGDVKPRNILLYHDGEAGYSYIPKITDFAGCERSITNTFSIKKVTPGFVDPIALAIGRADTKLDVFSFGLTMVFCVIGTVPRYILAITATLLSTLYRYPISVTSIVRESKELEDLVAKVIEVPRKDPRERIAVLTEAAKPFEQQLFNMLKIHIGDALTEVVARSITMNIDRRYRNCIDMWIDLKKVVSEMGYQHLLPKAR